MVLVAFLTSFQCFSSPAFADASLKIMLANGQSLDVDDQNTSRPENRLIIFNEQYGKSTRTNGFGVEMIAEPIANTPGQYKIVKVQNVFECLKTNPSGCGNSPIPQNGLVLSASGERRKALLDALSEGSTFSINETLFTETSLALNAINPNAKNNAIGSSFPGARGSNQFLLYSREYDKPSTGTNRFGFEVTVVNGRVIKHGGADSVIPQSKGDFILSGHGRGQKWLAENAPLGAKITVDFDTKVVTSSIDTETYRLQLQYQLQAMDCTTPEKAGQLPDRYISDAEAQDQAKLNDACQRGFNMLNSFDALIQQNQPDAAARQAMTSLKELTTLAFKRFAVLPFDAPVGVWHRPIETSREAIAETLTAFKQAGMNTVFLETYFHGYTIFPSRTYTAYKLSPNQNPKFNGTDLLALWIEEAHKRGMKVHAWIETFYGGSRKIDDGGPIIKTYPQWANVQLSALENGQAPAKPKSSTVEMDHYFIDPTNPQARQFLLTLIGEMIQRYPVDGIQLDYIRFASSFSPEKFSYHQTTWGYTDVARQAFMAETGMDPVNLSPSQTSAWLDWGAFKARQVSSFVEQVRLLLDQEKPRAKQPITLSVCIFPDSREAVLQKHQDWALWANQGWVDWLVPLTLTSDIKIVTDSTQNVLNSTLNSGKPVITGVFSPYNGMDAKRLLEQITAARQAGAVGVGIFDSAHITPEMRRMMHEALIRE
ncbi:MAG: family 10 glycosylhydrolase [Vampirovibrionales bacterium]|nr:family 10 glycosylhydrolase [Vampirovibrionales bacterium]